MFFGVKKDLGTLKDIFSEYFDLVQFTLNLRKLFENIKK